MPTPVIAETSWLIEDRLGPAAEAAFLRSFTIDELTRADLVEGDCNRCLELIEDYSDLGLGLVDASVIAAAVRLGIETIAMNHPESTGGSDLARESELCLHPGGVEHFHDRPVPQFR